MSTLFTATFLMIFLLWSYSILNRNFMRAAGIDPQQAAPAPATAAPTLINRTRSAFKLLGVAILLFLACYAFVHFVIFTRSNTAIQYVNQNEAGYTEAQEQPYEQQFSPNTDKAKEIRVLPAQQITTRFSDVAGLTEAKDEVQDIIRFLRDPKEYSRLGAKSPKGILLYGEPGTGKTLLARAIAGESNVAFIAVAGAEFDEEYIGVGAARVRRLFETARKNAPCIVFIDEIDALAHLRHSHDPSWSSQTVNQLLAEMDGLDDQQNTGVVVIGASNRLDAIDPAILRPGRLDRHIKLDIPTLKEREQILDLYLAKIKIDKKLKSSKIARITTGFSSADLANLVNEAAIAATKRGKKAVDLSDFDVAKDRVILGSKREALNISQQTRKVTAYHEAGHALVGHLLGGKQQALYKVTITPRGPTLGHTAFEPKDEEGSLTFKEVEALITMQLAGRAAEELIFGEQNITTGAENDLQNATHLAYNMVTRWGYSKRVGPVYVNPSFDFVSKETIEQEVQAILNRNYVRAKQILTEHRSKLDAISKALLEQETLDAAQVKQIISAKPKTKTE